MKKILFTFLTLMSIGIYLHAETTEDSTQYYLEEYAKQVAEIESKFTYVTSGEVKLGNVATIKIPQGFKFLNANDARTTVVDLWGNPDREVLGMLIPEKYKASDEESWAFVITFDDMGFVKDKDAHKMKYDKVLKEQQEEAKASNPERIKMGYEPIEIVGWASTPFYDEKNKAIHWAQELKFGTSDVNTLNYDIRLLGRKGVLSFNAVGTVDQLPEVKPKINDIINATTYNNGEKYTDFDPKLDKVAAYTVGGLVAGKVLAKAGIIAVIAKFGKIIVFGIIGLVAALKNKILSLFGKQPEEDESNTQA
jgi:uncharacterized membrane-anchored protein